MDLLILIFRLSVWMVTKGGGGGPVTEDNDDCARGQIVPC